MEKEGVGMALPIAIVEDQTPDAQRLEELLQQQRLVFHGKLSYTWRSEVGKYGIYPFL